MNFTLNEGSTMRIVFDDDPGAFTVRLVDETPDLQITLTDGEGETLALRMLGADITVGRRR